VLDEGAWDAVPAIEAGQRCSVSSGAGFFRRAAGLTLPKQSNLRTNDNTPGNGSGGFQCRVQVWR